jgi:hypothetical protein
LSIEPARSPETTQFPYNNTTRTVIVKKFALLFCAALLSFGLALTTTPVLAQKSGDKKIGEYLDDEDGTVYEVFKDREGKFYAIVHYRNGKKGYIDIGNPNPEDGKGSAKPDVKEMVKKAKYNVEKNPESTPLGGILNSQGKGFNPRGNPGDDTSHDKGPSTPHDGASDYKKSAKQRAQEVQMKNMDARTNYNTKTGMGDGSEGGGEAPIGPGSHGKGKNNDSGDKSSYKDHQNKTVGKTYDLGPKPEYINPNPVGPPTGKSAQKTPK